MRPTGKPTPESPAVSYAKERGEETAEVAPGVWRASFRLSLDERTFGQASQLLAMVGGWRSAAVEVDGSPEPTWLYSQAVSFVEVRD